MPMLIHSFAQIFGMDPLPVDRGSIAFFSRATWIQHALGDPCAFHTTLYAASAHLDAFQGANISTMTLYHHTVALQLLQGRLHDPDAVMSESLMACVATLVFFSAAFGDKESSGIHKKALMKMIKAKGGLVDPTIGTFLSEVITAGVLSEAIIIDTTLDIPFLDVPPTPLVPPSFFISAILRRAATKKGGYYNLSPSTTEIFREIQSVISLQSDEPGIRAKWASRIAPLLLSLDHRHTGQFINDEFLVSDTEAISEACHVAALIFWLLFLDDHEYLAPFSMDVLQLLVEKLRFAVSCGSMDTWMRTAPEAHTFP
ncbi:uncharacterized protein N7496_009094 [Penicillium cataractarum]|uniref:Transcription factor domain-containing protein n=1 Tax=Penicillium cataractarum TaxID=2100454 RepID=A0A9W9S2B9_9EURO|nr:uncharacterized protein N7496_009094 [Penicillium cataractarum]KAJ5369334.1 hypothetical protein N7496_009094 [Penicillium cataractarum]